MICVNHWPDGYESRFHAHVEAEARLLGVVCIDPAAMTVAPAETLAPDYWLFAFTGLKRGRGR